MRYDRIRRVLVVVVTGLLLPATLFPQRNLSSASLVSPSSASANSTQSNQGQEVAKSPARMVRVNSVSGTVMIKRPGLAEEEKATANSPIQEGFELSTSSNSSAEVHFENGSTASLNASSKLLFQELASDADGNKLSGMTLERGTAGFQFIPQRQDSYKVKIADTTLTPSGKTEVHAAFAPGKMQVNVLAGSVTVSAHASSMILGKGKFLEYHPSDDAEVAKSHARVVRLSYVSGTVMAKRPGLAEEEKVMLNTPVQEGFELSTSAGSYAEVEFENGSTARIGERSKLLFHQLALDANGNKLNGMTSEQGYATFHFVPERNSPSSTKKKGDDGVVYFLPASSDVYHVKVADATVTADGKCEFRTDVDQDRFRVEVFNGSVDVATSTLSSKLGEGKILENKSGGTELAFNTQKGIEKDAWDHWTEARDKQVLLTEKDEPVHPNGPSYGWSDLNTFGEWVELPGRRFGWSPYAQAGWSPYTNGRWDWYPGMGYTWISGEPWGWVTDHCGAWDFDASFGWYWMNPMFGCGFWQPSFVNWYAGPGWLGWAPRGLTGSGSLPRRIPPGSGHGPGPVTRPGHIASQIIRVPTSVVQNRQMITPQMVTHDQSTAGSMIAHPPFEPSRRSTSVATLPAMGVGIASTSNIMTPRPAPAAVGGSGPGFATHHATAPSTILMGGDAAKEKSLLAGHVSHSGHAPLRAFEGTTLGGRYAVHGTPGEFRGSAFAGGGRHGGAGGVSGPVLAGPMMSHSSGSASGAVISSHGSGGGSPHGSGFSGGSGGYSGGGGHSGGGGYSGGGGHSGGGGMSSGGGHSGGGGGASSGGGGGGHH